MSSFASNYVVSRFCLAFPALGVFVGSLYHIVSLGVVFGCSLLGPIHQSALYSTFQHKINIGTNRLPSYWRWHTYLLLIIFMNPCNCISTSNTHSPTVNNSSSKLHECTKSTCSFFYRATRLNNYGLKSCQISRSEIFADRGIFKACSD